MSPARVLVATASTDSIPSWERVPLADMAPLQRVTIVADEQQRRAQVAPGVADRLEMHPVVREARSAAHAAGTVASHFGSPPRATASRWRTISG